MNTVNNKKQSKTKSKVVSKARSKIEEKLETSNEKQYVIDSKDENIKIKLDSILDKKLVKFDNKQQMSFFFITYKSIDALSKELFESANYTIPDEIIKNVLLETVPTLIKEYNSNLRKRCRSIGNLSEMDDTICLGRKIDGTQCTRKKYNNNDFCKNHIKKLSNGRVDIPLEGSSRVEHEPIEPIKPILLQKQKENANITLDHAPDHAPDHNLELVKESAEESTTQSNSLKSNGLKSTCLKKNTTELGLSKSLKVSKRGRKSKIQFDPRQYDNEYITLWEDIVEGEKVLIDNANNIYTFDLEHPVYIGKKDVTVKLDVRKFMDSLAKKE
jgi:hypothetical protein